MATLEFTSITAAAANSITGVATLNGASVNAGASVTVTGPFYPSRNIGPAGTTLIGITEIRMPATALGTVFGSGCQMVFGRPQFKAGLTASPVLSSSNGPYIYDTTNDVWNENFTATGVDVDAAGSLRGITEGIRITITGTVSGENPIIRGDETCQPIFYGVTWDLRGLGGSNFNFVGGVTFTSDVDAAPQFYDNLFYVEPNANDRFRRFLGTNYIIRGLSVTNPNPGGSSLEFFGVPKVGSSGLSVVHNFPALAPGWGSRAALISTEVPAGQGGRGDAADPLARFYFDTPRFPCLPIWYGNLSSTRTYTPDRGATLRNPVAAPVPWVNGADSGTIPVMGNQSFDANQSVTNRTGAGATATFQSVTVNLDAPGYTLRIRREEIEVWNWRRGGVQQVSYGGETRASNGSYLFISRDSTPTLGTGARPTGSERTSTLALPNQSALATEDPRLTYVNYGGLENVAWQGLDVELTESSYSLALLASHQLARDYSSPSNNRPNATLGTKFFRYTLWAQHDERGTTEVIPLDFTPEGWDDTMSRTNVIGSGNDIEINLSSSVDTLYDADNPVNPSLTTPLTSTQELYNAVKTFNRTRGVINAYHANHLNSEVSLLSTPMDRLMNLGAANVTVDRTVSMTSAPGLITSDLRLDGVGADVAGITRLGGGTTRLAYETSFFPAAGQFRFSANDASSTLGGSYVLGIAGGDSWASANSIYMRDTETNSASLLTSPDHILVYEDENNWAVYPLGGNMQASATALEAYSIRQLEDPVASMGLTPGDGDQCDVVIGALALIYSTGTTTTSTAPRVSYDGASMTITIHELTLTRDGNVDGLVTTGDFDADAQRLDAITIDAGNINNVLDGGLSINPTDLDTTGGVYSGIMSLNPGSYNLYGDWSGATINRTGSSSEVRLIFQPGSVRPTAALGTGVIAPFSVRIEDVPSTTVSANSRLSVYVNGVLQTAPVTNGVATLSVEQAGTQRLDVIWSGEGRSDFRLPPIADVSADMTLSVVTDAQPYPGLGSIDPTDVRSEISVAATPTTTGVPPNGLEIQITGQSTLGSEAVISWALQNVVKGSEAYNNAVRQSTLIGLINSDGLSSVASINGTVAKFTSTSPYTVGFIREQSRPDVSDSVSVTGSFTPTGGTATSIMVGVTVPDNPAAFDPAITGAQIGDAVGDMRNQVAYLRSGNNSVLPQRAGYDSSTDYDT